MGSCQMGTRSSTSVVDPRGRVWGTKGLYVADASVFPTASGVNPMITVSSPPLQALGGNLSVPESDGCPIAAQNMSTAHSIARFIDEDAREALTQPIQAQL